MTTVSPQTPIPGPDFEREVYEFVRDTAPRLFAVVEEYLAGTEDEDARVLAWGMAHEDGSVEAVSAGGGRWWRLVSSEGALRRFDRRAEGCSVRLVWLPRSGVDASGREADAA
ncbi:hypothetical protein [Streptomyces jumonjinensis]|uniref:hypothetical protein n=1 Tax=Streptomyces jumonjinensis TaxID=1945 RepID=UPI0037A9BC1C